MVLEAFSKNLHRTATATKGTRHRTGLEKHETVLQPSPNHNIHSTTSQQHSLPGQNYKTSSTYLHQTDPREQHDFPRRRPTAPRHPPTLSALLGPNNILPSKFPSRKTPWLQLQPKESEKPGTRKQPSSKAECELGATSSIPSLSSRHGSSQPASHCSREKKSLTCSLCTALYRLTLISKRRRTLFKLLCGRLSAPPKARSAGNGPRNFLGRCAQQHPRLPRIFCARAEKRARCWRFCFDCLTCFLLLL